MTDTIFGGYANALKVQRYSTAMVIYDSETDTIKRYERVHTPEKTIRLTHQGQLTVEAEGHWSLLIWKFCAMPPGELAV